MKKLEKQAKHIQKSISRKYEANKQGKKYIKTNNIIKLEKQKTQIYQITIKTLVILQEPPHIKKLAQNITIINQLKNGAQNRLKRKRIEEKLRQFTNLWLMGIHIHKLI